MIIELFGSYSYWCWLGTMNLLYMTWHDYKNKDDIIPEKYNYLMLGITLSLFSHLKHSLLYILLCILIIIALISGLRLIKNIGQSELSTMQWVLLGFAIIHPIFLGIYSAYFALVCIIYILAKTHIFKNIGRTRMYIVIIATYISACILMGLY